MSGRLSQENLDSLIDMAENKSSKKDILFPGVSIVYLNEDDAFELYQEEHKSRQKLENVLFQI